MLFRTDDFENLGFLSHNNIVYHLDMLIGELL